MGDMLSDENIKTIQINMLQYIHEVCEKNNLKYYICGGTLIGAVRHKGFIPWDDDIDINMSYEDFVKFVEIVNKAGLYKILTINDKGYYYYFGKIVDTKTRLIEQSLDVHIDEMGVYIDVFPLDGVPASQKDALKWFRKMRKYNDILESFALWGNRQVSLFRYIYRNIKYTFRYIDFLYYRVRGIQYVQKKLEKEGHLYKFSESDYVCSIGGAYGSKEIYPKKIFENTIQMPFEGHMFNAPIGYHDFLTQMYGDYMQMPPKEKQVSNHDFEAYWRD